MENVNLAFSPELPLQLIIPVSIVLVAFGVFGIFRNIRGSWVRFAAMLILCLALFNPVLLQEDRTRLKTIIPVVVDQTTSQKLDEREAQTATVLEDLREKIAALDNFEIREVFTKDQISTTNDVSTALFSALSTAVQDVPKDQIGGAIFITDGQVHDIPQNTGGPLSDVPLHVLLTGNENERDRRIFLTNAPRFGVVGESQEIRFKVEENGFSGNSPVEVVISLDGEFVSTETVLPGEESAFVFEIPHGGKNIIEFKVEADPDEISAINNQAFTTVNGIRENLRVLLVSGEPHAGERTWRNLLKSDASVDLVHFTILRPPEKQDGTPINELSLIAFPTRELFVQKIDEFDLIIFDRYKRRGVLPVLYFDNIARYVQNGGAVLVAAGPEYAEPTSIAGTPLNVVLPALANGSVSETPFTPRISETGQKHPVTRKLDGWNPEKPGWSRWFRSIGVVDGTGRGLMVDERNEPLLLLDRQGEGRIALFLSDHAWLWARGFEGGGPHVQLLRRLAHWLMKEPELEEERLTAETQGQTLNIVRQSLGDTVGKGTVTTPSGEVVEFSFDGADSGIWQATLPVEEIGLYRIENQDLLALAQVGPGNPRELAAVISTTKLLQPAVDATSGSIRRIADSTAPRIVPVGRDATYHGRSWIGLVNSDASVLNGVQMYRFFTGLLGLAILLLALAATWYREAR